MSFTEESARTLNKSEEGGKKKVPKKRRKKKGKRKKVGCSAVGHHRCENYNEREKEGISLGGESCRKWFLNSFLVPKSNE